jgi:hypothetical protein
LVAGFVVRWSQASWCAGGTLVAQLVVRWPHYGLLQFGFLSSRYAAEVERGTLVGSMVG